MALFGCGAPQPATPESRAPSLGQQQQAVQQSLIPHTADASHATKQLEKTVYRFFENKSAHDVTAFVDAFAPDPVSYGDAVVGWVFPSRAAMSAALGGLFPYLPPHGPLHPHPHLG